MSLFPEIDVEGLLKRIPRPERSGYISVAVVLLSLWTILHPDFGGADCGFLSLRSCAVAAEEITPEEEKQAIPLYFGSGPGEAKDMCHMDVKVVPGGGIASILAPIHTPYIIPRKAIGTQMPHVSEAAWWEQPMLNVSFSVEGQKDQELTNSYIAFAGSDLRITVPPQHIVLLRWHCPKEETKSRRAHGGSGEL